ncbi:MAG TPA: dihydroorotate dehydrogenase [Armatimonadota bacterium]|jgi:dihydroorotate dehydrogenase (NAD+) catalytic subunit
MTTVEPDLNNPLNVRIGPLVLRNPVMTASGTFGFGLEYADLVDLNALGAIVTKATTLKPRAGNPPPRTVETPSGMLNAIGLQNDGVEAFLANKLPKLRAYDVPVIVNIAGTCVEEYAALAAMLDVDGVAGIEMNISCPNVGEEGVEFCQHPAATERVVSAVRAATRKCVICKLSPGVTDITVIARAAEAGGADAVSVINTLAGLAVDVERRRPKLANVTGGLSGPAIRPVAVRMAWQAANAVRIPVIGIGGIITASDALEFLIAGATAVQVGTGNFVDPRASLAVLDGIRSYLQRHGMASMRDLIGTLDATKPAPLV